MFFLSQGHVLQLRLQALLTVDCSQYLLIRVEALFSLIVNQRHDFFLLPFFSSNVNVGSSLQDEVQEPQLRRQALLTSAGLTQYLPNRTAVLLSFNVNQRQFRLTPPLSREKEKLGSSSHGPSLVGDRVGGSFPP
jgi:hypothetical protein